MKKVTQFAAACALSLSMVFSMGSMAPVTAFAATTQTTQTAATKFAPKLSSTGLNNLTYSGTNLKGTVKVTGKNLKSVTYKSSNTSVLKVSKKGVVTVVGSGTATITAKAVSKTGATKNLTKTVTVAYSAAAIQYDNYTFDYSKAIASQLAEHVTVPEAAKINLSVADEKGATGVILTAAYDTEDTENYYLNALVAGDKLIFTAADDDSIASAVSGDKEIAVSADKKTVEYTPAALKIEGNTVKDEVITFTMTSGKVYKVHTVNEYMPTVNITGTGVSADDAGVYTFAIDKFFFRINSQNEIIYYRNLAAWSEGQCENFGAVEAKDGMYYTYFAELQPQFKNSNGGYSSGVYYVMDKNYVEKAQPVTLYPNTDANHTHGQGYLDQHEFVVIEDGHYLLLSYTRERVSNLPDSIEGINGSDHAYVWAGIFQEVKDGKVIKEISTTDYPLLYESAVEKIDYANSNTATADDTMDYVHPNSLDYTLNEDGTVDKLLVSMRDQSAVYQFDMATGNIDWILGGKASTLSGYEDYTTTRTDDNGVEFNALTFGQHYARYMESEDGKTVVSIFDNQTGTFPFLADGSKMGSINNLTRTFVATIDENSHTATISRVVNGTDLNNLTDKYHIASHCGSVDYWSDTSVCIGWGLHGAIDGGALAGALKGSLGNAPFAQAWKSLVPGSRPVYTDYNPVTNTVSTELSVQRNAKTAALVKAGKLEVEEALFSYRTYKTAK